MRGAARWIPAFLLLLGAGLLAYWLWPAPDPAADPLATVEAETFSPSYAQRFGVTGPSNMVAAAYDRGLPFSSYGDWSVQVDPPRPGGAQFWQVIRVRQGQLLTPLETIDAALEANPGAAWIVGNEPDVAVQDNTTPQAYAEVYHEVYTYIKERDPSALVAIGAVSQPTPLRRAYLDIVLDTYEARYGQRMPVDIWNVHAFILREEDDSWGIGIPPGMDDELAILYEIEDHNDVAIFSRNIRDFRAWMAQRGYGDRPLLVSEFGFLMPYDFGFTPQDANAFLHGAFEFLLTTRDETGFAPDGGRLVQWWLWFIVWGPEEFATSFLYDREHDALTGLGEAYTSFYEENAPQNDP